MPHVLLAASRNWMGTARLPLTLSRAGIKVDVIAPIGSSVLASSRIERGIPVEGSDPSIAEKVLDIAPDYDRVILCDDPILAAMLQRDDSQAVLPAPRAVVALLTDKTRFPQAAQDAGIPVPRWEVVHTELEAQTAAERLGGPVVVKGAFGCGGGVVRAVDSGENAAAAALGLGFPALIEERMEGELALMPCLFERGRLIGAFAAQKLRTVILHGPSATVVPWAMDGALLDIAVRAGEKFKLHGFVSVDLFRDTLTGETRVIELNPRPVPTLHIGRRLGVDMAGLLASALEGRPADQPVLSRAGLPVPLYPQELNRLRASHGQRNGMARWLITRSALREMPWGDPGLLSHYVRNGTV